MTAERQRLFVGVPIPEALVPTVNAAQASIEAPGLRLLRREQLHVTLAFLGEVGSEEASAAARVVSEQGGTMGGAAVLGGILLLPTPRRARVVALEIDDGEGVLARLSAEIVDDLVRGRVMAPEKRPFRPHLTIARLREAGRVHQKSDSRPQRFEVRSVCLYRSRLARAGAEYEVLTEAILGDREDTEVR